MAQAFAKMNSSPMGFQREEYLFREGQEGAWMGLALGQGGGDHGGGGRQPGQRHGIIEQRGRPLAHRLQRRRAKLV